MFRSKTFLSIFVCALVCMPHRIVYAQEPLEIPQRVPKVPPPSHSSPTVMSSPQMVNGVHSGILVVAKPAEWGVNNKGERAVSLVLKSDATGESMGAMIADECPVSSNPTHLALAWIGDGSHVIILGCVDLTEMWASATQKYQKLLANPNQ